MLEHLYVRYFKPAVANTNQPSSSTTQYFANKKDCFSNMFGNVTNQQYFPDNSDQSFFQSKAGSSDNLMIRSCSIPESLAAEWELDANSHSYGNRYGIINHFA